MTPSTTGSSSPISLGRLSRRYGLYLVLLVAGYWAPILLLRGHPLSDQFLQSSLLLMVAATTPLNYDFARRLRWWARVLLMVVVGGAIMAGHAYVTYGLMGHENTRFSNLWASVMIVYVVGGTLGLQRWLLRVRGEAA
jgi:hypothetical protein